jgi:hypothetical protein
MKNPMSVNEHVNISYRVYINNLYIYITYYCYFYYKEKSCGLDDLVQ